MQSYRIIFMSTPTKNKSRPNTKPMANHARGTKGMVLGPLLFIMFINDIIYYLYDVCLHLCRQHHVLFLFRYILKNEPEKTVNLALKLLKTTTRRQIRVSFKLLYASVVVMKRFSILMLVMSWWNLCPLWNCGCSYWWQFEFQWAWY